MKLVDRQLGRSVASVVLVVAALGCAAPAPTEPPAALATNTPSACDSACGAAVMQARSAAELRATHADQRAAESVGQCELTLHELDSLRRRDAFEDTIYYRLAQADITENGIRGRLAGAAGKRKQALEATLASARSARDEILRNLGRVRTVPDVEWPRFTHDLESAVSGLDAILREPP